MTSDCCKSGRFWPGETVGKEVEIFGRKTYQVGDDKDAVLVILHDVFGWSLNNTRLSADYYAKHCNVTVLVPDFFDGEVIDPATMDDPEKWAALDLNEFIGRNSREIRQAEILDFFKRLKSENNFRRVGAFGFCWGGWASFMLGNKDVKLVDAFAVAHPAMQTEEDIGTVGVPVQVHSPEFDQTYTEAHKKYTLEVVPTLGVDFDYQYYPQLYHVFGTRGDLSDKAQKRGVDRLRSTAAAWFNLHLHDE